MAFASAARVKPVFSLGRDVEKGRVVGRLVARIELPVAIAAAFTLPIAPTGNGTPALRLSREADAMARGPLCLTAAASQLLFSVWRAHGSRIKQLCVPLLSVCLNVVLQPASTTAVEHTPFLRF